MKQIVCLIALLILVATTTWAQQPPPPPPPPPPPEEPPPAAFPQEFDQLLYTGKTLGGMRLFLLLSREGKIFSGQLWNSLMETSLEMGGTFSDPPTFVLEEISEEPETLDVYFCTMSPDRKQIQVSISSDGREPTGSFPLNWIGVLGSLDSTMKADIFKATCTAEYPLFLCEDLPSWPQKLNQALRKEIIALQGSLLDQFGAYAPEMCQNEMLVNSASMHGYGQRLSCVEPFWYNHQYFSMVIEDDQFTGGAHGNTYFSAINLFNQPEKPPLPLTLKMLFAEGAAYLPRLNELLMADLKAKEALWIVDGTVTSLDEELLDAFTLSPEGIRFYFAHYLVAPYAAGVFRCSIPWSALDGLLQAGLPEVFQENAPPKK